MTVKNADGALLEDEAAKADVAEEEVKNLDEQEDATKNDEQEEEAVAKQGELFEEEEEAVAKEDEPVEDEFTDDAVVETAETPLGAQVVSQLHSSLADVRDMAAAAVKPVENPQARELIETEVATMVECLDRIEGAFSQIYPEEPSISGTGEEEAMPTPEAVKSWVRGGRNRELAVAGLGSKLAGLAAAKNITRLQRKSLLQTKSKLDAIVAEAKSEVTSESAKRIEVLETRLKSISKKLETMAPASR